MSDKFLHRKDAPFQDKVWHIIDETIVAAAKSQLCGRRLLHTEGPYGLALKTLLSGDFRVDEKTIEGTTLTASCAAPVAMTQSGFKLAVRDIAAFEETGLPFDLAPAANAAIACARQEDMMIFNGSKTLGLNGLLSADHSQSFELRPWDDIGTAAQDIISAVTLLDDAGFHGPYTLALAPKLYNLLYRRYPQGHITELEHLKQIATEGIVKAPVISSGGVLLCPARQYATIVLGQDLMTAFVGPATSGEYEFVVSESVALRLRQPEAIYILK